jgi:hypothetical protein
MTILGRALVVGSAVLLASFSAVSQASPLIAIRSYAYDGSGQGSVPTSWPDLTGFELIDGDIAPTSYTDTRWVGFLDSDPDDVTSQPQVTFDLGNVYKLSQVQVKYYHSTCCSNSVTAPESLLVSFSTTGLPGSFSAPVSPTAIVGFSSSAGDEVRTATFDLSPGTGRYARLDFQQTSAWTFLTEVGFQGNPAVGQPGPAGVASYAYDGTGQGATPSVSFADTGGIELTNGLLPQSTAFSDSQWVGFADDPPDDTAAQPRITFRLDDQYALDKMVLTYLHSTTQASGTITAPEEVLVSVSRNGVDFSTPISLMPFDQSSGDSVRRAVADLTGLAGDFVRLDFRNTSQWTFFSEVSFTGTVIPEPSSVLLLALGLIGLLLLARRRTGASGAGTA